MFRDKPSPSLAYLGLALSVIVVPGLMVFVFSSLTVGNVPLLHLLMLALVGLAGAGLFFAAFDTRYTVRDGMLEARAWPLFRKRVPLSDICGIKQVDVIGRPLGWAPGVTGCCNRFTRGLCLTLPKGIFYISPRDLSAMESALREGKTMSSAEPDLEPRVYEAAVRWIAVILGATGILIGAMGVPLVLGMVPPNSVYGVRTAGALASESVWYVANARGGWCMLAACAGTLLVIAGVLRYGDRYSPTTRASIMVVAHLLLVASAAVFSILLVPSQ